MIERGGSKRFPAQAFERTRVVGYFFRHKFQRDVAAKLRVLRLVYNAHSAVAQLLDDAVVRDGVADHVHESDSVFLRQDACKVSRLGSRVCPLSNWMRSNGGRSNQVDLLASNDKRAIPLDYTPACSRPRQTLEAIVKTITARWTWVRCRPDSAWELLMQRGVFCFGLF